MIFTYELHLQPLVVNQIGPICFNDFSTPPLAHNLSKETFVTFHFHYSTKFIAALSDSKRNKFVPKTDVETAISIGYKL